MKSVGIIAEYNPFHNGHLYHLQKIKEMYKDYCVVLVCSSSFTQRGTPSIIDKWTKRDIALKSGIDLVIELPFVFSTQSADIFAEKSLTILEKLKVDEFVFGSETNDISLFEKIAKTQIEDEEFDPLVKIYLKMGQNYPTAMSLALKDLIGETLNAPNDLLGISYVKTIIKNKYKIKPHCIKRENNYHSKELENLSSATAIRKALQEHKDIKNYVPDFVYTTLKNTPLHFEEDYFKFLKYKIMLEKDLNKYEAVDEGFGDRIKKEIIEATSIEDLINKLKTKRYTKNKINRMLTHILCDFTKDENRKMKEIDYIRVLGFNDKGRTYLNSVKKDLDIPLITNFSREKPKVLEKEFTATCVYASTLNEEDKKKLIQMEYKNHPMKGDN